MKGDPMGKRGPKPAPSKTLQLRGSWRADQNAENEIEVPPGMPGMPDFITGIAAQMWVEISNQLFNMGTLAEVDRNVLVRYCTTWQQWRIALEHVEEHGQTIDKTGPGGIVIGEMISPQTRLIRDFGTELGRMESTLGIGAANRVGIAPTKDKPETGKGRFFA